MSKAVIDFCNGLETSLLAIEERLGKATKSLSAGAQTVETEAKRQVEEASEHLAAFRAKAAVMAAALRRELPEKAEAMQDTLAQFGLEAQTAMRHAVVFMAEAAAKGATGAAGALKAGAGQAHEFAEHLRRETAVAAPEASAQAKPASETLPT